MDKYLPFYYWTINERFQDEGLPSFDKCPEVNEDETALRNHPLRLYRLYINQQEVGSVLEPDRAILPASHRGTLTQSVPEKDSRLKAWEPVNIFAHFL